MKKFVFVLTIVSLLLLGSVAFAAHPCDMCGSGATTLVGSGAWCHWYCEACDYTTSRNHDPNSYNSGLSPDSCSGSCRWCGAAAAWSSHTFGEYVLNADATCTTDGTETSRCTNAQCSAAITRAAVGSALGHDYVSTVYPPVCEMFGYTAHVCSRCGDSYEDQVTRRLGHAFNTFTNNGDGTHSSACSNRLCRQQVTEACSSITRIVGGSEITLCPICGHVISEGGSGSMETTEHAQPVMDATELPGELIVLVDAAPIDLPLYSDVFYLFVTSLQKDGREVPFSGRMEIRIDLNEHPFLMEDSIFFEMPVSELNPRAFKIVRVENQMVDGVLREVWIECPFTLQGGVLTFETEKMGVFLMVLNIADPPAPQQ